ncbi:hypothetical protein Scep_030284 [Stephania cephalantha]|uniref:tRNA (guanine-N(7)-)-methyltransferase non-catalytic subunit n=1 Tax=Stephania cephalantha TaxID=152367 RepID=A0AAP0E728_9MAGN
MNLCQTMEETLIDEAENNGRDGEVAPALIAVHPLEKFVAVAIGSELRVFDLERGFGINLLDDSGASQHSDSIRTIGFSASGKLFASAGDDKLVKVWSTDSWQCIHKVFSEKRVSAAAISCDDHFVSFADKFGIVWIVSLKENERSDKGTQILAHYCSIITSLEFSPDGKFILSADRDFKIRVTVFPKKPLSGAHEIQSYCLGHTEFVSCVSFIGTSEYPQGFLLSGGGDSTVRLWDFTSGTLLDTCEVGAQAGILGSNGDEGPCCHAVTDICASPDGSLVAVAIQRQVSNLHGVMLLTCDLPSRRLSVSKVVTMQETFIPSSLGISVSGENLWMVSGASNLPGSVSSALARVKVISRLEQMPDSSELEPAVLEDNEVPGGTKLLETLQGSASIAQEEETLAAAAEAVKTAMRNLLIKRQYSVEKRELRKKSRNDRKLKQ